MRSKRNREWREQCAASIWQFFWGVIHYLAFGGFHESF